TRTSNRSHATSNRVSLITTRILKIRDQRLAHENWQDVARDREKIASETRYLVANSRECRANSCEQDLRCRDRTAWQGGRTRTSEWRNQNPRTSPKLSMLILKKQRNSTDSPVNGLVSHSEWIRGHEDRRTYCGWRNAESEAYQRALCRPI